jgi:hypothetical protein
LFSGLSVILGNRHLQNNELTSLEVGVFNKNTALSQLYVDQKQTGGLAVGKRLHA